MYFYSFLSDKSNSRLLPSGLVLGTWQCHIRLKQLFLDTGHTGDMPEGALVKVRGKMYLVRS